MSEDLISTKMFDGKEIRLIEQNNDKWIPIIDLSKAWGLSRNTLPELIDRNEKLFTGYTVLAHVTWATSEKDDPISKLKCVNEQGLYLLMGKITSSRIKNPKVQEAILSFQKWVPELIKKYRKGELKEIQYVTPSDIEKIVRSHLDIADAMVQYAHVDRGIMTSVALTKVESETGADLAWLKSLIRKDRKQPDGYLTPTDLGNEFKLSAISINKILQKLGYQYWEIKGWVPTMVGRNYGESYPYSVGNRGSLHSGFQWKWSPEIVKILRKHLYEEPPKPEQGLLTGYIS